MMIITLIALLVLCLCGIRFGDDGSSSYISKNSTNTLKGVFILLVFLSHIQGYLFKGGYVAEGAGDWLFLHFFLAMGQLVVVMFLFYSGYGVMTSISKKGDTYVRAMPRRRFLATLLNFDVAVCAFLVATLFLGQDVSLSHFLLSLVAWDSLGNSNWYIFSILACYLISYICASARKFIPIRLEMAVLLLVTAFVIVLHFVKEPWWYNTLWAYPTGMFYSSYREKVESFAKVHYMGIVITLCTLFIAIFLFPIEMAGFRTNLLSVVFAVLVVVLSMRIKIGNRVLRWYGERLFPVYIYQRLSMIVLAGLFPASMFSDLPIVYVLLCLIVTTLIAYLYKYVKISC